MKKVLLFLFCLSVLRIEASPLSAAEAFSVTVLKIDLHTFAIHFHIKPHYFLYAERMRFSLKSNQILHLQKLHFPPALHKTDKQGHHYKIYRGEFTIPVSISANKPGTTQLALNYQGCSDEGFCYASIKKTIQLSVDDQLALMQVSLQKSPSTFRATPAEPKDRIAQIFMRYNWIMILLSFFGFGLLLSFTPCILPMVPVLSGIIIGHSTGISTRKAFFLSLNYVLSMSLTYALVGAAVALLGANLQISMQSPWSISLFSLIFVLLALSMFGFYEFKLPESWQSKINGHRSQQRGGHYLGAAIMGCLSTLILSPCVTAPLLGVLTYIAQTGNILLGCLSLFFLSLGMGSPLLLIGTSAGKWLPETGSWMNTIKAFFAVLFIAVAISLISRILAPLLTMLLWASLLIFSGIYSGALTYSISHWEKFKQGLGLMLVVYGFLILVGASKGASDPLQPLKEAKKITSISNKVEQIQTLDNVRQRLTAAVGKPVMLDFYADWCISCKVMEATTFADPQVQEALNNFTVMKIDVTVNNPENKTLLDYFQVIAPPTFIFFNAYSQELVDLRLVGEISTDKFLKALNKTLAYSY